MLRRFSMSPSAVDESEQAAIEPCSHRLILLGIISSLATLLIAACYPSGKPADELMSLSFAGTYLWIAAQAFALTLPGLVAGMSLGSVLPRFGALLGGGLILAVPIIVLCDVLTFTWIAERFLSGTMARIVTSLLPALALHTTPAAMFQGIVVAGLTVLAVVVVWKLAGTVARKWESQQDSLRPLPTAVVLTLAALVTSFSALKTLSVTVDEMARSSTRHPFCAFHLVGYRGVGVAVPTEQAAVLSRLRGLQAIERVQARERRLMEVAVDRDRFDSPAIPNDRRKVIFVVVECLRPEVIDPSLMPNLHAFAEKSIVCNRNFASGNSTCISMFSMVNGLESLWFERPIADYPIMNRLLRQAGFGLAFYGGQTDWSHYSMDGFISPTQFDLLEVEDPDLPASDLRAIQRTMDFIDQETSAPFLSGSSGGNATGSPRAAICYLFATHSSFRYSEPEFQVFQPEASEGLLISHAPELRDQFFNRYKNSLRSMDHMLKPLLRDDCVVIVTGDHGEPFMDDGTAIHGTRLSRFQNMTPAVIYYPGVQPRKIESPTFHADLLPTLLSILQIPVTDPEVFDGVDLITADNQELAQRSFASCNFIDSTAMLVGPWSVDPSQPFGYRFNFDIRHWQADYLNPIDEQGYEWEDEQGSAGSDSGKAAYQQWVAERFGEAAMDESRSEQSLLTEFLQAEDKETRLSALEIAASFPDPDEYLYELIADATRDEDAEIRDYAKEMVIRINRYRGQSEKKSP